MTIVSLSCTTPIAIYDMCHVTTVSSLNRIVCPSYRIYLSRAPPPGAREGLHGSSKQSQSLVNVMLACLWASNTAMIESQIGLEWQSCEIACFVTRKYQLNVAEKYWQLLGNSILLANVACQP